MFQDIKAPGEVFSPVFSDPSRKLLWDSAQYMRKHGHVKHMLVGPEGQVCVNGALMMVIGTTNSDLIHNAIQTLVNYLSISSCTTGAHKLIETSHVSWNNAPERTENEVIEALEGAALS